MRHQNDGEAALPVELDQRIHDFVRGAGVQVAGGFVGQQHRRRIDQGAGDGDALLLAAGKLAGRVAFAVRQAEQLQRLAGQGGALGPGQMGRGIDQRQLDIFQRAGARQEIEALEHEAELFAADRGRGGLSQPRHIHAFEEILPAGGPVETAQDRHQGGLARAGRAHDGHEFAAFDSEIDAA